MKERATYATSNATRMVAKVNVDGGRVGGAVPAGSTPGLEVRALGTAAIDHIDVIHNGAVEYRKDFLIPEARDPAAVQIMFHTPTETPGDEVRPPASGTSWGGWIEVSGGRIASLETLGVDHFSDEFRQVDERRVWFAIKTRGDFDGVLLRLAEVLPETAVAVRVAYLERDGVGTGGQRRLARAAGPPGTRSLHEVRFQVNEVTQPPGKFEAAPGAQVFARKVKANGSWDAALRYRPARPPAQDDYYYVRVVQVDGETAWTSPFWVWEPRPRPASR